MKSADVIAVLEAKGAVLPCAACGHDSFTLVEGDFALEFVSWGGGSLLTGGVSRSLECIALVCDNCGLVRQHAVKPLGLSPQYRRI